jgi:hypothetical protein
VYLAQKKGWFLQKLMKLVISVLLISISYTRDEIVQLSLLAANIPVYAVPKKNHKINV